MKCFKVFCERPTTVMARAQTWSNYKQHNTVKKSYCNYAQRCSIISKGWSGHVSDVHLTENCGLLHHILPGDLVLADRGFTIQDSVGMYCTEVKIPPFTHGKKTNNVVNLKLTHHGNSLVFGFRLRGSSSDSAKVHNT